jgi:manganese transport protein
MDAHLTPPTRLAGALRFIGPGLILTAGVVGTGELVLTPRVASEHGFSLLWLILLGCMVKVFVQIELGRYAVARGATTLAVLDEIPGPRLRVSWMLWVWLPVFLAMISVIGGILAGTSEVLALAGVTWPRPLLIVLLGLFCAGLLASGRYRIVELGSTILVVLFTVATLWAVLALQWTEYRITGTQIAEGFTFHLPSNFASAFATLGIIGVGAAELLYYPYWCLEKGYARRVGPRSAEDGGWLFRARGWLWVMRVDAWTSLIVYTTVTAAFYLLGAAVLFTKGLHVSNQDMVKTLANMYLVTFGPMGLWIFLLGAFAVLYSTAFAGSAANARLLADALALFGVLKASDDPNLLARRVRLCSLALPLYATLLCLAWPKPVTIILISGMGQAILLPFLAGAALYFRHRKLDASLRPGRAWTLALWLSAASLAAAGLYQLIAEIRARLG